MISKTLQDAVNEQINKELYSAYLYLAMSAQCENQNLPGVAQWLKVQFKEEQTHALRFYQHLVDRGGQVVLKAIDRPPEKFGTVTKLFEQVLAHEQKVTGMIHKLLELALKEKDHALAEELQWFVKEQVEEEKNAAEIVARLKMAGEHGASLLFLDKALGERKD
jgi:ferritin